MISPVRLAILQLRRRKARLAVAILGVAFAVILMFMQLGFRDALYRSALNVHRRLETDLVMIHPHYTSIVYPQDIPRVRLYQALGFDGVASVTPLYSGLARWRNPDTGKIRDIFLLGVDPARDVLRLHGLESHGHVLRYPDVVLYDALGRPEYGEVARAVRTGHDVTTEVNLHEVTVQGLVEIGTSFGVHATILMGDLTFFRVRPDRVPGTVSVGLIRLARGANAMAVRDAMAAALPRDVVVLTLAEYMDREVAYWASTTPIGYVFAFGVVVGLLVGAVVVYQILFADVTDHLPEYATLKAIGFSHGYLGVVVVTEALLLATFGFLPGLGVSWWLFETAAAATRLPMEISPARGLLVLSLTVVMCTLSGLVALRKLRAADPADVF